MEKIYLLIVLFLKIYFWLQNSKFIIGCIVQYKRNKKIDMKIKFDDGTAVSLYILAVYYLIFL